MLFTKIAQHQLILTIDTQSSLVRGNMVLLSTRELPKIIFSSEISIPFRSNIGGERLVRLTVDSISEIIASSSKHLQGIKNNPGIPNKIDSVHFILSSPWVTSQARTISINLGNSIPITEKIVMDIVAKEREGMIPDTNLPTDKISLVEEKVFNVKLNGYVVSKWQGRKAEHLEISFVTSVSSMNTSELFRSLATIVTPNKVHFHSSLLCQYIAMQYLIPDKSSYVLIHIHGEITDVAVITGHACTFFGSFPVGVRSIIRYAASISKTDLQVADSTISLIGEKAIGTDDHQKISELIQSVSDYWIKGLNKLIHDHMNDVSLPRSAILCAHKHEDFFIEALRRTYPSIEMRILTLAQIRQNVWYAPSVEPSRQSGLYAMALNNIRSSHML